MNVFDKFLNITPKVTYYPEYDSHGEDNGINFEGIKALTFDGADCGNEHTKVFAHIGFPENAQYPVPAVVLVHGGGGHPEDKWIRKWNARGYAAISMDTTGFFPTKPLAHLYEGSSCNKELERTLVAPFAEENYTVSPDNSGVKDSDKPIDTQWMYHAVSQVILAHNILRADERIDNSKIGISGISWGGVITSIAIGYDTRFAFAVPIYGSGYLSSALGGFVGRLFQKPHAVKWLAEKRFYNVKMPVMWLCWNDDHCFAINSNSMSYLDTKLNNPNTCLSMLHQMYHSHYHGYTPQESYWFADTVLSGKKVPQVNAVYTENTVEYYCSEKVTRVRLFYITEEMRYAERKKYFDENNRVMAQDWCITELDCDKTNASLPENAVGRYVEFTLENGIVLTTPYNER